VEVNKPLLEDSKITDVFSRYWQRQTAAIGSQHAPKHRERIGSAFGPKEYLCYYDSEKRKDNRPNGRPKAQQPWPLHG
jgi:hypothetical protein